MTYRLKSDHVRWQHFSQKKRLSNWLVCPIKILFLHIKNATGYDRGQCCHVQADGVPFKRRTTHSYGLTWEVKSLIIGLLQTEKH